MNFLTYFKSNVLAKHDYRFQNHFKFEPSSVGNYSYQLIFCHISSQIFSESLRPAIRIKEQVARARSVQPDHWDLCLGVR